MKGLTTHEVQEQIKLGHINISPKPLVKTNKAIIREHVFNLFNAYNFVIMVALIAVQAWSSLFFVVIVTSNAVIRILQDIRSRNMVAKLNLIISPRSKVLRDGKLIEIDNEEIVLNDVIYFETGQQISSDSIVLDEPVEVDESLLTGEADPVLKGVGEHLLSGSFIVSGACYARVEHVGLDNYATHIANEARQRKPITSQLIKTFSDVTRWTSYLVAPLSFLMIFQALVIRDETVASAIINTSTALLGMLPKGLVLLTTVSMAASVVRLGEKNVLVQEMFSIETLSHVDVLCLDKTGTLTEGKMKVQEVIEIENDMDLNLFDVMCSFVNGSVDNNVTSQTLRHYFEGETKYKTLQRIPFSSARKWSANELEKIGTIIVGAPEFILPGYKLPEEAELRKKEGARVLLIAQHSDFFTNEDNISRSIPVGVIVIKDPLREDAREAIEFFKENEVEVKVISGDNPVTVCALAKQAGIVNDDENYIDASTLKTDKELEEAVLNYDVIGRASPGQKHKMILALQEHDLKVAMTGDGVNDVLALKDADVSIAMESGSDAAKQIAQFVIINGQLSTMIDVVKEGRLDINNVTRSAAMYYLKTIYTIVLAFASVFMNMSYPFIPFQMTWIDNFVSGFPSFMLLFERDISKQKESIGRNSMRYSLPNAMAIILTVIGLRIAGPYINLSFDQVNTILYFTTSLLSIHMVYRIYAPVNFYRGFVFVIDVLGLVLGTLVFWNILGLVAVNEYVLKWILIVLVIGLVLAIIISKLVNYYLATHPEK